MRRFSLSMLLAGICLLTVGIGGGMSARSHALAALDGALANKASEEAEVLADYFSRARSIDLLTAHNPAFQDFYALPGDRQERVRSGGPTLDRVNQALAYLERLFPDSIGEACFIDRGGAENARVVRGVRAAAADLSADESANPFFRPTFALAAGDVYQARPYVSPDTGEWVISNSTLMPTRHGSRLAIVHFEITIDSFRRVAATLGSQFGIAVVDSTSGAVIIDSGQPQRTGAPLGAPGDIRFRPIVRAGTPKGTRTLNHRPTAYQRLDLSRGNANHWYVVAAARDPVGPLYGVGLWSIAIVVVAMVLLAGAAVSYLTHHRDLVAASMTDALTGIANRRKLKVDLERGLSQASPARPLLLMLFDLNGFKAYNDIFGHPAGDALLIRLAAALHTAMAEHGASADRQTRDVLLRALQERNPELAERHSAVARLADAVAERLGLPPAEHAQLRHAAELHDVGKMAVPEQILQKPAPLDADEWTFLQQHPVIGARIIGAAPALAEAAGLVRATHERYDGAGYPDGLAAEQIPLGARIIAACDALIAMTSPRPHAPQRTIAEAVAELRRCSGTQFDPTVVEAVCELA